MKEELMNYIKQHNIKIKDIIKCLGTKYPITFYRKVNGKRKFAIEEVNKLNKEFGIPTEFFLDKK